MLLRPATRPVVRPICRGLLDVNNNGWPLRNQLFDGAPIALPLTHTVIGRGGLTPSFTRATTETGQKWDETGYLDFTALAGEMVFKGARREYNQWTTSSVSLANGANKSLTLAAGTYQFSMGAGTGTATFSGTGGATGTLAASTDRVSVAKTITAGTFVVTASVADLADLQVCNITGETDQTTIRPYVSVGVESAPAYHGSMVDGVKCFDTDRSGNPISTSGSYPIVGYVPWETRTNLCLQSQDLGTTWTNNNTTESVNVAVAPDGTTTADKLVEAATNTSHTIHNTVAGTSGVYTTSVYLKAAERTWAYITEGNSVTATAYFNLANGVVGTVNGTGSPSSKIVDVGGGWYRCSMTFTAGANANIQIGTSTGDTISTFLGDITKGIYVWGAQLELGSAATSYIPTTTVAVARNADVESVTTSGAILAAGGTISLTYVPYHSPSGTIALWGTYVDASNYTAILHDATNLIFRKRIAGVNYDATIANAFTSGTMYKMAASWGSGGSTIYLNGVAGTLHANTTAAQIAATMQFGADGNSLQQPGAAVINSYIWQRQLSGSEQAAVTA